MTSTKLHPCHENCVISEYWAWHGGRCWTCILIEIPSFSCHVAEKYECFVGILHELNMWRPPSVTCGLSVSKPLVGLLCNLLWEFFTKSCHLRRNYMLIRAVMVIFRGIIGFFSVDSIFIDWYECNAIYKIFIEFSWPNIILLNIRTMNTMVYFGA